MRKLMIIAAMFASGAACIASASAHITLETKETRAGAGYKAVFRVPHGCEGAATTAIAVEIPEGLIGVKPMPKPGWAIAVERGPYARAYRHYHGDLSEGVKRVIWTGGPLADEHYDEFVLSGFLAREIAETDVLHFPVRQTCQTGESYWSEIAPEGGNPHDMKFPAAMLLLAAETPAHDHAAEPAAVADDLTIERAWARATPPGAKTGAGYVEITNKGSAPDRLTGASLDGAGRVELHETLAEGGVMKMREREGGIEIAPGATISFAPGGLHLMFLELSGALTDGGTAKGKLVFEKAGEIEIEFPIRRGAPEAAHEHHHH